MVRNASREEPLEIVIDPAGKSNRYWQEVWQYRELAYFLCWRDILVRYKQTAIGIVWAVLRPLLTIVVFTSFGAVFHLDTHGAERLLLVGIATLPWILFSSAVQESSMSLVANTNLMTKVYFPRLIVPFSAVLVCIVDFAITLIILVALMIHYANFPGLRLLVLPFFLFMGLLSSTGAGVLLAALNVKYRDFRYVVPFLIQLGFFVSPIAFTSADIYASEKIPSALKLLYSLNPMVAVIEGFRWSLLANFFPVDWKIVGISCAVSVALFITGCWYFRKFEMEFADVI